MDKMVIFANKVYEQIYATIDRPITLQA